MMRLWTRYATAKLYAILEVLDSFNRLVKVTSESPERSGQSRIEPLRNP